MEMSERTPRLRVSASPRLHVAVSPRLHVAVSPWRSSRQKSHTVTVYARAYSYSRPPTLRRADFTSARPFFSVNRRSRAASDGLVGTRCLRRRSAAAMSN
jgi:hypothetical protein